MAKLDSLIVDLQLNSAQLRRDLDQVKNQLNGFGASIKGVGDQLRALTQFQGFQIAKDAVAGLTRFVAAGAEVADQMGKMAQSAGTTVETFSRLDYAAGLAGLSSEDLSGAFSKLNKNLAAAAAGAKEPSALFTALGVRVTDASGKVRDSAAVMEDLATKFASFQDGASKSALAMEVFGKSGAQMIPFLNEGGEGLKALADEADRFGITISTAAAEAAEAFNDNLEKLARISSSVGQRVAAELTPALVQLTDELLNTQGGTNILNGVVSALSTTMKVLGTVAVTVGAIFEIVGKTIARLASAIVFVAKAAVDAAAAMAALQARNFAGAQKAGESALNNLKEGWADLKGIVFDYGAALDDAGRRAKLFWSDSTAAAKAGTDKQAAMAKESADGARRRFEQLKGLKEGGTAPTMTFEAMDVTARFGDADHDRMLADYKARQEEALIKRLNVEHSFTAQIAKQVDAFGTAFRGQLDNLLTKMGTGGQLMQAGIEGMASGGPWGALLGVIIELVSRMSSFTKMIDFFNASMGRDIEQLGNALAPLFEMMQMVSEVIHGLLGAFGADVMTAIKFALMVLAKSVAVVALGFVELGKFFSDLTGNNDQGLLKLRDSLKKTIEAPFEAVKVPAEKLGEELDKAAEKLNEFTLNLPDGFKLRGLQFAADLGEGGWIPGGGGVSGGSSTGSGMGWATAEKDQYKTTTTVTVHEGTFAPPNTEETTGSVTQGQFGDWAPSTPSAPAAPGTQEWFDGLSKEDRELWYGFYNVAKLVLGLGDVEAANWASVQFLAVKGGKSSSSSAATAAASGGGGGAFNINGGNSTATASLAAPGGGVAGGMQTIHINQLNLYGVGSIYDLWVQLQEVGYRERAGSRGNGAFSLG